MTILYALQGLPASGKTTWAQKHADRGILVSNDVLRIMHGPRGMGDARVFAVLEAIAAGHNVILDCCNLTPEAINEVKWLARQSGAELQWVRMDTGVEECVRRDAKRRQPVGEAVIREMARWVTR